MKAHRLGTLHELDESQEYEEEKADDDEDEEEEEEANNSEEDNEEEVEKSEEEEEEASESNEIFVGAFFSRGRILQSPKRFDASTLRSMGLEKEVEIELERVDRNWPRGRVKRVKTIMGDSDGEEGKPYEEKDRKAVATNEEGPFLVTIEDALKIESVPVSVELEDEFDYILS